jgi:beta-phosphoglucomutase-like phosphatase (HAD superfamily)
MPDCGELRALLFDFDGTLWDSESAVVEAYRQLYAKHGQDLPSEDWARGVGTLGGFDPVADLEARLGRALEEGIAGDAGWDQVVGSLEHVGLRPGVRGYLDEAQVRDIALAIVSSNERDWVEHHLKRMEVADVWDAVLTADGDEKRAKPSPVLYAEALDVIGVGPEVAAAIEDSPHGVAAAKAAGLYCVAVPNEVTASLDLSAADLQVASLEDLPFEELLQRFREAR